MTVRSKNDMARRPGSSRRDETGMATSEYAVGTIGACGVACVLLSLRPELVDFFRNIIEAAFSPIITGLLT